MSDLYTLEDLGKRLGGIPISTLKHRIQQLGIPAAARGSRNKLLFDERAVGLLEASDQLMKEGHGINTTRRLLKLDLMDDAPTGDEATEALPAAPQSLEASMEQLAQSLAGMLARLEAKDQELARLHEELRRSTEASATFQQKTFYLQGELQRLQGELKEARTKNGAKDAPWQKLWKRGDQT